MIYKLNKFYKIIKQFEAKLKFYERIWVMSTNNTIYLKFTRQNKEWQWLLKEIPMSDLDFAIEHYKNKLNYETE